MRLRQQILQKKKKTKSPDGRQQTVGNEKEKYFEAQMEGLQIEKNSYSEAVSENNFNSELE
jgi:hypothetical protein